MPIRFSLDRFEGDLAVCYDENDNKYDFPKSLVDLEAGALFTASLDSDGNPIDIQYLAEETAAKKAQMKKRLSSLFGRSKKK